MELKKRIKLFKSMFRDANIGDDIFEKIENKCITMNHLGFSEKDVIHRLDLEVKKCLESNERYRFNFANIAEKYDFDIKFLD